ncbi:uncharacterized protein METZ01_LOCUS458237, partial [marine metagenome]
MNASETTAKQESETATPSVEGNGRVSGKVTPPRGYAADDM